MTTKMVDNDELATIRLFSIIIGNSINLFEEV